MNRAMKDSGIPWIGEIPEGWEVSRHKNIMFKKKDIQEHYSGENIISLTMNGVVIRDLTAGGKIPLSFDGYQKVQPGNLLLCLFDIDVTPRCVGLIKNDGVTSPAYSQFVLLKNANAPYFDYLLRYMDDYKCLLHLSKNLRSSLTETDFGMIPTCLPPLAEQEAIAAFLDRKCGEVDEMVSLQEQVIEELKAYKQSVITEAVTKGLNPTAPMKPSNIDWIGQIPTHWEKQQFRRIFIIQKRIAGSLDYDVLSVTQGGLKVKDLSKNEGQMAQDYSKYQIVGVNDYVMNHMDLITGFVDCSKQIGVTSPDYRVFHAIDESQISLSYYLRIFQTCYKERIFYHLGQGVSGMGRWRLPAEQLKLFYLPLPPLSEQREIADFLDRKCADIDALIALKQQKIEDLKQYKKSLIYEYVTGKKQTPNYVFH